MGHGEHDAAPGRPRASGAGTDDRRLNPDLRRELAAAGWEPFAAPAAREADQERDAEGHRERPADHTARLAAHAAGAISVADLIAKVGSKVPDRPIHHHGTPDTEATEILPIVPDVPLQRDELQDTQVIDIPAYSLDLVSDIPDLGAGELSERSRPTQR